MKEIRTLHIKNMVCPRCIMAVRQCLENLGMPPQSVELGTAVLSEPMDEDKRRQVAEALQALARAGYTAVWQLRGGEWVETPLQP